MVKKTQQNLDLTGKFAHITNDLYEPYGIHKDELVFIAGSGFYPVDENDNYKLLFVVTKIVDGKPDKGGITAARTSLKVVSNKMNKKLLKEMEQNFAQDREAQAAEAD